MVMLTVPTEFVPGLFGLILQQKAWVGLRAYTFHHSDSQKTVCNCCGIYLILKKIKTKYMHLKILRNIQTTCTLHVATVVNPNYSTWAESTLAPKSLILYNMVSHPKRAFPCGFYTHHINSAFIDN